MANRQSKPEELLELTNSLDEFLGIARAISPNYSYFTHAESLEIQVQSGCGTNSWLERLYRIFEGCVFRQEDLSAPNSTSWT